MPARALIDVDIRIANLRDEMERGQAPATAAAQLEELLKKRGELVVKMVNERSGEFTPRADL